MIKSGRLYDAINLLDIAEDGLISGLGGEVGALYKLRPLRDTTLMDDSACGNHARAAAQLMSVLPPGAALSFFIEIDKVRNPHEDRLKARLEEAQGGEREALGARLAVMQQAGHREAASYLCLSIHPLNFLKLGLIPKMIFPYGTAKELRRKQVELTENLRNLEAVVTGQLAALAKVERLPGPEAVSFYWRRLNPSKARAGINQGVRRPFWSLRSQLALSAARDEADHFWVDGFCHRGVSLHWFGEHLELGGMDRLLSKIPTNTRLAVHFMGLDLEAALDRAKADARSSGGLSFLQGTKNYEAQAKAAELDELVTLARSKGERLLIASVNLLLRDRHAEKLRYKTDQAVTVIREAFGAEALEEDTRHKEMFLSQLPFGAPLGPRRHTLTGAACANLASLSDPWAGCAKPGIFFGTREGGTLSLDPFDGGTPRHGIVIGSTGSGKSFTMNCMVSALKAIDPKTQFVIVDVGGSYKRLCELSRGQYFEINLTKDFAINPFPQREAVLDEQGNYDPDLLGYLTILIEKMLERGSGQSRRQIIEKAICVLYEQKRSQPPLLGDLAAVLDNLHGDDLDRQEAKAMVRELRLFTEGSYAAIMNSPKAVNPFASQLSVFDLAKLKEHRHLQSILISVIGFGLAKQMNQKDVRKVVILDEGWEFFDDGNASELVSRLYRTARKFNGMIVSVSQSPKDFLKSKASTAMLANSYWKAVLRLDMGHDNLAAMGLNVRQIEAVKSLTMQKGKFAEVFVVFGENSRVVRLEPTPIEYWMATTNAEECAREDELMRRKPAKPRIDVIKELASKSSVAAN